MEVLTEMIMRGWENFTARPSGALSLRFLIQPALAAFLGIRAGLNDARLGRPPYLWAALTDREHRGALIKDGLKDLQLPLIIAAVLDAIYQTVTHQAIFLFELVFTVVLLALIPYAIVRAVTNRIARFRARRSEI